MHEATVTTGVLLVTAGVLTPVIIFLVLWLRVRSRTRSPECRDCGIEVYQGQVCAHCRRDREKFMEEWSR